MNQGPRMAKFASNQNPLRTKSLSGCTVGLITSTTQCFGIHVSRGNVDWLSPRVPKLDAQQLVMYVAGQSPIEMARIAANQLVALWNANREANTMYKGMVLSHFVNILQL